MRVAAFVALMLAVAPIASAQVTADADLVLFNGKVFTAEPGQALTVMWRGKPIFIRHRTEEEIAKAKDAPVDDLPDPLARNANLPDSAPASDDNRAAKDREPWLVMVGVCTHLGCIPKGQAVGDYRGEYGGWFCPCHGSQYDTAGRVRIGPAPENLAIPPYKFVSDQKIKIG